MKNIVAIRDHKLNQELLQKEAMESCISLYKLIKFNPAIPKITQPMHVYLSGMLARKKDRGYQEIYKTYAAQDQEELTPFLNKPFGKHVPNYLMYLVLKNTAEQQTFDLTDQNKDQETLWFGEIIPRICYEKAAKYSVRLGHRTESKMLKQLHNHLSMYLDILSLYNKEITQNPFFEITESDFEEFKKDFLKSTTGVENFVITKDKRANQGFVNATIM